MPKFFPALFALVLMLAAPLASAREPYLEEDFATWPAVSSYSDGTRYQSNWRMFSVGGAGGTVQRIYAADGNYLRIARASASGDAGLDRDQPDQTILVPSGVQVVARVWARRNSATATLDVRIAEYQDLTWTGVDHAQQFALGAAFTPYTINLTTGANTNRLNFAVRALPGQTIEINRIELLPVQSAASRQPRILLPQGWTPNLNPVLWWQSPGHGQVQVQLATDIAFTSMTWDSGPLVTGSNHLTLPSQTPGQRAFARVRVQDFSAAWGVWSDPTTLIYDPLPQLPAQELYFYSLPEIYGLAPEQCYEQALMIAALQGLANRQTPRLFLFAGAYSQEWLDKLTQPGRWMEHVTVVKNPGAAARYQTISTAEGPGLRINRSNLYGDTGIDLGLEELALPIVTSNTTIQVTCRARAVTLGARLDIHVPEYDADFTFLGLNNAHSYTPTSAFQDFTFTFTTGNHTSLIHPALRAGTIGTLDIRSISMTIQPSGTTLFADDFVTWEPGTWQTPGTWPNVNGWRIFGTNAPDIVKLAARFRDAYDGVVLWDPAVPASSNVAATIAGVENLLPIPLRDTPGSLYRMLVTGGPQLPVKRSLVGLFTGTGTIAGTSVPSSLSKKNDAYRWAIENYLKAGLTDPTRFGYYVDAFAGANHSCMNMDFFVMKRGFLWDLNMWDDETPIDDPAQPLGTDVATLKQMFGAAVALRPQSILQCGGFPPFTIKYSNFAEPPFPGAGGTHEPVPTEWKCAEILSSYNVELEADGGYANASVYAHMPRPVRINQAPPPLYSDCQDAGWITTDNRIANRTFVLHYVGDYDSPAWLNTLLPPFWDHPLRGKIMIPWAWDPNMSERGMAQFDEFIRTRTPNDALWAGDSGAGYTNPNQFFEPRIPSGLPDGSQAWRDHCAYWFRMFDVRQTGYIINGNKEPSTTAMRALYESFSGDGMVDGWTPHKRLIGSLPSLHMNINVMQDDPAVAAQESAAQATAGAPSFIALRSILKNPQYYYQLNRNLQVDYPTLNPAFMSPSEFFYLLRYNLGGQNVRRAAFLGDTVNSGTLTVGETTSRKLWVRNLGWQTWASTGGSAVRVGVELASADQRGNPQLLTLPHDVAPGQMVELSFNLTAPAAPGVYHWRIDFREGASTWFGDNGNLPESRAVQVTPISSASSRWQWFK